MIPDQVSDCRCAGAKDVFVSVNFYCARQADIAQATCSGQDRLNPGHSLSGGHIDRPDSGMGMGTPKKGCVKHSRNLDVIHVGTLAGHESRILESSDWLSRITQLALPSHTLGGAVFSTARICQDDAPHCITVHAARPADCNARTKPSGDKPRFVGSQRG